MLDAISRYAPDNTLSEEERQRNSFGMLVVRVGHRADELLTPLCG